VLIIGVTDTGMDQATVDRVFEPFFTTKDLTKGTGLGLSPGVSFRPSVGGHIRVYSEPGNGTCVKAYLPRMHGDTSKEHERSDVWEISSLTGSEAILVTEDDEDLRSFTVGIVRDLGYRVREASDAKKALDILEQKPRGGVAVY
jgi:hypothetical protein